MTRNRIFPAVLAAALAFGAAGNTAFAYGAAGSTTVAERTSVESPSEAGRHTERMMQPSATTSAFPGVPSSSGRGAPPAGSATPMPGGTGSDGGPPMIGGPGSGQSGGGMGGSNGGA